LVIADTVEGNKADSDDEEQKRKELLRLLQSWLEEDEKEQIETLSYLKQALDDDRLSDRKLFL